MRPSPTQVFEVSNRVRGPCRVMGRGDSAAFVRKYSAFPRFCRSRSEPSPQAVLGTR
jgi:hypothetical protein